MSRRGQTVSTTRAIAAYTCFFISLVASAVCCAGAGRQAALVAITFAVAGLVCLYLPGKVWDQR